MNQTKPLPWILFALFLLIVPMAKGLYDAAHPKPVVPVYASLPEAIFLDENGKERRLSEWTGKPFVADFIFTHCPDTCPVLSLKMKALQSELSSRGWSEVMLLSITVDPDRDTPERLREYFKTYSPDPHRWTFLTGSLPQIEEVVVKGFHISMGREPSSESSSIFAITHGERFVLVDAGLRIRGYYDVVEKGLEPLLTDLDVVRSDKSALVSRSGNAAGSSNHE